MKEMSQKELKLALGKIEADIPASASSRALARVPEIINDMLYRLCDYTRAVGDEYLGIDATIRYKSSPWSVFYSVDRIRSNPKVFYLPVSKSNLVDRARAPHKIFRTCAQLVAILSPGARRVLLCDVPSLRALAAETGITDEILPERGVKICASAIMWADIQKRCSVFNFIKVKDEFYHDVTLIKNASESGWEY